MKRRHVLQGLATAASTALPQSVFAQRPESPLIGFLGMTEQDDDIVKPFLDGLAGAGFSVGRNVAIHYAWANGNPARLPALVAELLNRNVAVIVASGGHVTARAAQAATRSVPIVFEVGADPAASGLVASLKRPGGNMTGVHLLTNDLNAKRLDLLHQMVPRAMIIGLLTNPTQPRVQGTEEKVRDAAAALGLRVQVAHAGAEGEFDAAFATLAGSRVGALLVGNDPFFNSKRGKLVALTNRHGLPSIFEWRSFTAIGGLMSYGTHFAEALRLVGDHTARILKGALPADLPVVQSRRFELVINRKTAAALGLVIPQSLLLQADEVID